MFSFVSFCFVLGITVSAMMNIKKTYGLSKKVSWQGDPCSPQIYRWEGVDCLYLDSDQPLITSLYVFFLVRLHTFHYFFFLIVSSFRQNFNSLRY